MSIEQVNSAAFDYDVMLATLEVSYVGKANITISEFDSTAAPDVKIGSKFENNGALFKVLTGDETPAGYAGISNSTTFYLMYDVSEAEFAYTEIAPTWNDGLQGWYETGETDRYFFSMYKDSGGTLYETKTLLPAPLVIPEHGGIGSLVIAASTDWATTTEFLPGTTVTGASLIYSTETTNGPLSARGVGSLMVVTGDSQSAGLSGTWRLLSRVYLAGTASQIPVGLFQRIS